MSLPKQEGVAEAVTTLCSRFIPVKNDTPIDHYLDSRPRTVLNRLTRRESALENPNSLIGSHEVRLLPFQTMLSAD